MKYADIEADAYNAMEEEKLRQQQERKPKTYGGPKRPYNMPDDLQKV